MSGRIAPAGLQTRLRWRYGCRNAASSRTVPSTAANAARHATIHVINKRLVDLLFAVRVLRQIADGPVGLFGGGDAGQVDLGAEAEHMRRLRLGVAVQLVEGFIPGVQGGTGVGIGVANRESPHTGSTS